MELTFIGHVWLTGLPLDAVGAAVMAWACTGAELSERTQPNWPSAQSAAAAHPAHSSTDPLMIPHNVCLSILGCVTCSAFSSWTIIEKLYVVARSRGERRV